MRRNTHLLVHAFFFATLLLTLLACESQQPPSQKGPAAPTSPPLFQRLSPQQSGILFPGTSPALPGDPTGLLSGGASLAAGDLNHDGLTDLVFTRGFDNTRLYLNQGNMVFSDITEASGLVDAGEGMALTESITLADVNGDGWLDIYVLKSGLKGDFRRMQFNDYGKNLLFIHNGDPGPSGIPTFTESAAAFGLDLIGLSVAANFFDYDNDGDLDVYIIHTPSPGPAFNFSYYSKLPASRWFNDQFLENIDGKRFVDARKKAGILYQKNIGLSTAVGDINNDGWLDLYVANDFLGRDFLYLNQGNKTFREQHQQYFSKTALSAMGTDFADINNDGWLDLFVGEMMPESHERQKTNLVPFSVEMYEQLEQRDMPQYTRNLLQLNQGGKRFRDVGMIAGVHATEWSWSSIFFDADNDGYQDLFVPNGIKKDMTNMDFVKNNFGANYQDMADPAAQRGANLEQVPSVKTPNFIFKNTGQGAFQKANRPWGITDAVHTRGATYADLDNDGDLDLILNNMDEQPLVYMNTAESRGMHWLRLRLKGKGLNTYGMGAKVVVYLADRQLMGYLKTQTGYQATPEPVLHFGLGEHTRVDSVVVFWLGGEKTSLVQPGVDQVRVVDQNQSAQPVGRRTPPRPASAYWQAVAPPQGLNHRHREQAFNDFKQQRLLHRKYSLGGPALAVADVNADGADDLFVGGAAGSSGTLYLQTVSGRLRPAATQPWAAFAGAEDMGAIFFDANGDGHPDLYVGAGSNETPRGDENLKDRLYLNDGLGRFSLQASALPDIREASGPVCAADVDGDGDQDLFVGGRMVPGDYGAQPVSYLLLNEGGTFTVAPEEQISGLANYGRITAALWSDVDLDDDPDLVVAGEWLPITVFFNDQGRFRPRAIPQSEGWWNSLQGADLDQDGDIDFIAGNHGLNSVFKASPEKPVTLLTEDFDRNGALDPVIFHYIQEVNGPFVNRDVLCSQMPAFNQRFFTFEQYAKATIDNMFDAELLESATRSEAYQLQSAWVENLGSGQFALHPLPPVAQRAPVYGIQVLDVNQDTRPDLILGGNFSGFHYAYGALDALEGLVLLSDGEGGFVPLTGEESGLDLPFDLRALALFAHKGAPGPWLIAANNDAPAQTFVLGQALSFVPALPQETHAILTFSNGKTQRKEFYQGGGYLSQNSKGIWWGEGMQSATFYAAAGESRTLKGPMQP